MLVSGATLHILSPFSCKHSSIAALRKAFELCESLNAVGAVLDVHKLLENRKASPESRIAALQALGEVSKAAGESNSLQFVYHPKPHREAHALRPSPSQAQEAWRGCQDA